MRVIFNNPRAKGITAAECDEITVNSESNAIEMYLACGDVFYLPLEEDDSGNLYAIDNMGATESADEIVEDCARSDFIDLSDYDVCSTIEEPTDVESEVQRIVDGDFNEDEIAAGLDSIIEKLGQ